MSEPAKILILFGLLFLILGLVLYLAGHIPLLGKLPGDIHIQRRGVHIFFPVTTSILLSVILTVVVRLLLRR